MVKEIARENQEKCPGTQEPSGSLLSNWPVQIHLVPEDAPYLKGADILIASDCVPTAYRRFHRDFVDGRALLVGCPKLDDADFYRQKLTRMFRLNNPKSVTVARMEVPCCGGMPALVKSALEEASVAANYREILVGIRGNILADTGS